VSTFIDTSAIYALLDADDANHDRAVDAFKQLRETEVSTHAYVIVESLALVTRRLGRGAAEQLIDDLLPVLRVEPVDAALHAAALIAFREAGTPGVSFVDRTSFAFMRQQGLRTAFAFDADFARAGFAVVPART
jgi:predicted nucleic acid-binding protein